MSAVTVSTVSCLPGRRTPISGRAHGVNSCHVNGQQMYNVNVVIKTASKYIRSEMGEVIENMQSEKVGHYENKKYNRI